MIQVQPFASPPSASCILQYGPLEIDFAAQQVRSEVPGASLHLTPLEESRYCGKCGGALKRQLPARLGEGRMVLAGHQLPVT